MSEHLCSWFLPVGTVYMASQQGWTALAKHMGLTPWSWDGQRPRRGSPDILLFEQVLCTTLPGDGPGKTHHYWTIS